MNVGAIKSYLQSKLLVLALFAVSLACLAATMRADVNPYDEGLILVGATNLIAGEIPHRDFYTLYGPAQFALTAMGFKLFGTNILAGRLIDVLTKTLIVTVVYRLCRDATNFIGALIVSLATLVWLCTLGAHGYPLWFSLLLILVAIHLLARDGGIGRTFLAGVVAGLVFLFRYDIGIAAASTLALVLFWRVAATSRGERQHFSGAVAATLVPFIIGASVCALPLLMFYAWTGTIQDLIFQVIEFPAAAYRANRGLPFPLRHAPVSEYVVYLPILVMGIYVIASLQSWRAGRSLHGGSPWMVHLAALLSVVMFLKGIVRVSALHMSVSVILSLIVFTVIVTRAISDRRSFTWVTVIGSIALLLATITTLAAAGGALTGSIWRAAVTSRAPTPQDAGPHVDRAGMFAIPDDEARAIEYVRARTEPDEPIFVGTGRHDKIFVSDISFYFLAERQPATKWYDYNPGLQTTNVLQLEMVRELQHRNVRYVVLTSRFDNVMEPNGSALSSGVHILDDDLKNEYSEVAVFGTYRILLRNR